MEIVFVRHGVPDYRLSDERKMTQLEKDYAPITRECIPFIKSQSELPIFLGADIIISSPYTRALQTAEIINRQHRLELFVEHDLREWVADMSGGYIELEERDRRWQEYRSSLKSGRENHNAEYETAHNLKSRVISVLDRYQDFKKVIIVAHFNVLESLLGYQEEGIGCGDLRTFKRSDIIS
ncbi:MULTISPECIES: histidine phosphatase family protein [Vibrio]|uniref:Histidine phosphatase family protein n=1 Tax=Vibrio diazotrophicus TaxID=685 RepID=A0A2J8GB09_VIBDI|nr:MULTISPECIES: histidine phosphatase family protein [Vibrio]MCF7361854.1 phosphoglycerate mutase family protein [Vibrio sp. A1-b2]PNH83197.1 histidine phosphatase family protein [Vibrio diazotrophicus]PNH94099.1 histidine phosphatase family protein [Vibrio diazotrophicus]PNI05600.1 histidine phosphatase family protein [Vibrio diazotrophicus]